MKKFLTSDSAWKVYSVLIAILLWGFVVVNQNPTGTKPVSGIDVYCTNIDALEQSGLTLLQDEDLKAAVKVEGKRLSIAKVDKANVSASFTVPEIKAGTYEVPIDVKLPISGVNISDKSPYTATVVVEKLASAELPVEVIVNGAGSDAKLHLKTTLSADSVVLSGPASVIRTIDKVTATVNKADVGKTIKADIMIFNEDGEDVTEDINIQKSFSAVSVTLVNLTSAQTRIEAAIEGEVANGYVIENIIIKPEKVLLGTEKKSNTWVEAVMTTPISVQGLTSDTKFTAELIIPDGYELLDKVEEVEIRVEIGKIESE